MSKKDENTVIVKTYTCDDCSVIYHAFQRPELEEYLKKTKKEQDIFDNTLKTNHDKSCYNKFLTHKKQVSNAPGKS